MVMSSPELIRSSGPAHTTPKSLSASSSTTSSTVAVTGPPSMFCPLTWAYSTMSSIPSTDWSQSWHPPTS